MLSFSGSLRVFVAVEACDMRNHSEFPIIPSIPSGLRKPGESLDSSGFWVVVHGIIRALGGTPATDLWAGSG